MSTDRLSEAARVLRESAERAPQGPWHTQAGTDGDPADGPTTYTLKGPTGDMATGDYNSHDGYALDYAAMMYPAVGIAVAHWLDSLASRLSRGFMDDSAADVQEAVVVADLILGRKA